MKKDKPVRSWVSTDTHAKILKAAYKSGRSVSNYINWILIQNSGK